MKPGAPSVLREKSGSGSLETAERGKARRCAQGVEGSRAGMPEKARWRGPPRRVVSCADPGNAPRRTPGADATGLASTSEDAMKPSRALLAFLLAASSLRASEPPGFRFEKQEITNDLFVGYAV